MDLFEGSQYQGPSLEWESLVSIQGLSPPTPESQSVEVLQASVNKSRIEVSKFNIASENLREKVVWEDFPIPTGDGQSINGRVYRPSATSADTKLPIYLFFHGGGFLFGDVETEDATCSRIVANYTPPEIMVVSINYRHTPEFRHPTQINDARHAVYWLSENASRIGGDCQKVVIGGISAGALLAASLTTAYCSGAIMSQLGDSLHICGQLLAIPWLIQPDNPLHPTSDREDSSYNQNINAPILPLTRLRYFAGLLDANDVEDAALNPALVPSSKIGKLPKSAILIAGQDPLRDEGLFYAQMLQENGVPVKTHVFPGLPHGFRRFPSLPSSARWDDLTIQCLQWILSEDRDISFAVESVHGS